jgi:hypothetical protein
MLIDESGNNIVSNSSRLSLTERFEKIQGARPGLPPSSENSGNTSASSKKTLRIIPRPR